MATRIAVRGRRLLARGARTIPLVKLAEGPLHLRWKVARPLAIPAHVDLVEGGEGEQFLLGFEIAEKCAPGYSRVAADFLHCGSVETNRSEEFPRCPFNLFEDELVFPLAKRPGILRFRPLFAAESVKRFLHCMQI